MNAGKMDPLAEIERVARELRDDAHELSDAEEDGGYLRSEGSGMLRAAEILRPYVEAVEELLGVARNIVDNTAGEREFKLHVIHARLSTALAQFQEPTP